MVLGLLQQPYVLAVAVAVTTAGGMFFYTRSLKNEPDAARKAFFQTLVVGLAAGLGLVWLSGRFGGGGGGAGTAARAAVTGGGGPEISTEPFMPAPGAAAAVSAAAGTDVM